MRDPATLTSASRPSPEVQSHAGHFRRHRRRGQRRGRPGGPIHPLPVVLTTGWRATGPSPGPKGRYMSASRAWCTFFFRMRRDTAVVGPRSGGSSRACVGPSGLVAWTRCSPGLGSPGKGSVGPSGLAIPLLFPAPPMLPFSWQHGGRAGRTGAPSGHDGRFPMKKMLTALGAVDTRILPLV